jgi:hypothetical protein
VGDELTLDGQLQRQRQSVFEFIAIESGDGAGMEDKRAGVEEAVVVDKSLSYWTMIQVGKMIRNYFGGY